MGDFIKNLPTDNTVITTNEMNIMNTVFLENKKTIRSLYSGTKDIIIAGILFFIFTLPFIDSTLGYCFNFVNTVSLCFIHVLFDDDSKSDCIIFQYPFLTVVSKKR